VSVAAIEWETMMAEMHTDATSKRCEACKENIAANDKFCKHCGAKIGGPVEAGTLDRISAETPPRSNRMWRVALGLMLAAAGLVYYLRNPDDFSPNSGNSSRLETVGLKVETFGGDVLQITNIGNRDCRNN
jgi:hypothetical protein